jgi:hypothetical protein
LTFKTVAAALLDGLFEQPTERLRRFCEHINPQFDPRR